MSITRIEWTDATWNPVTGCTKTSAGSQAASNGYIQILKWISGNAARRGFGRAQKMAQAENNIRMLNERLVPQRRTV